MFLVPAVGPCEFCSARTHSQAILTSLGSDDQHMYKPLVGLFSSDPLSGYLTNPLWVLFSSDPLSGYFTNPFAGSVQLGPTLRIFNKPLADG